MKRLSLIIGLLAGAYAYIPVRLMEWLSRNVDVAPADWMRTPGRMAELQIGPFGFGVNTADGGSVGMSIGRFQWSIDFAADE